MFGASGLEGKVAKRQISSWLTIMAMLAVLACASRAAAQYTVISVVASSVGSGSYSPGATINNLGSISVTNNTIGPVTISSVTVALSNSSAFSSLTLNGTASGSTQAASASPSSSTTFTFSLPAVLAGGIATFSLSGVATSSVPSATVTATPISVLMREVRPPNAAAVAWPPVAGQPPWWFMVFVAIGLLLAAGRLRRRHLVVVALGALMAATQLGCGNVSLFGSSSSNSAYTSTQTVTALGVSAGAVTGLPLSLGTISIN